MALTQSASWPVSLTPKTLGQGNSRDSRPSPGPHRGRRRRCRASIRRRRRCVAVGAEEGLARARRNAPCAPGAKRRCPAWERWTPKLQGGAGQEVVVIGVLVIGLQQVVVDILGGQLHLDPRQSEGHELQHRHRAGGVLQQGMVDADAISHSPEPVSPQRDGLQVSWQSGFLA